MGSRTTGTTSLTLKALSGGFHLVCCWQALQELACSEGDFSDMPHLAFHNLGCQQRFGTPRTPLARSQVFSKLTHMACKERRDWCLMILSQVKL